jgi:hypothetical protein
MVIAVRAAPAQQRDRREAHAAREPGIREQGDRAGELRERVTVQE